MGADVLRVLFGAASGNGQAYRRLMTDEYRVVCRTHLGMNPGKPVGSVSESGLYKLIMRSDKPEAKAFQDWVTREVLPSIRKNGGYIMPWRHLLRVSRRRA